MSILKREQALVFKARANPQVYAFTSQLIMYVLKDSSDWPKSVAKVTYDNIFYGRYVCMHGGYYFVACTYYNSGVYLLE